MKNSVIFGGFKPAVKDFNLAVLSFRQVFFANLNGTTAAGQRRAENAHNYFTILFSENGTDFRLLVSYYIEGIFDLEYYSRTFEKYIILRRNNSGVETAFIGEMVMSSC